MSPVLFFDPLCPKPYDTRTLAREGMGGTESTLTRVADALGALVAQHNRQDIWDRYLPPVLRHDVECVVVNRDSRALALVHRLYPRARIVLWLHDRIEPRSQRAQWLASTAGLMRELQVQIVCVSDWQRSHVEQTLRGIGLDHVRTRTIYNPVDDALVPDATAVDYDKLVFFSSPNKGLRFALDAFRHLRMAIPALRLYVGNPGYKAGVDTDIPGVIQLGAQPQHAMHAHVRESLATFAPNFTIPETFGLVFAESHALGTPVLAHDCGAAREVIGDPAQLLAVPAGARVYDALLRKVSPARRALPARWAARFGLFDAYLETLSAWRTGARPRVAPDARFHLSRIAQEWRALLTQDET